MIVFTFWRDKLIYKLVIVQKQLDQLCDLSRYTNNIDNHTRCIKEHLNVVITSF